MPSTSVIKAIGWSVRPGDPVAHYFKAGPRGLVALSMCGLVVAPKHLRPAKDQPLCVVCDTHIAIQYKKEDRNTRDTYDTSLDR